MGKLIVHRKKQLRSAFAPYWLVLDKTQADFINVFWKGLSLEDLKKRWDAKGFPLPNAALNPQQWGIPIQNGEIIELEIDDRVKTVFAITTEGLYSNEIVLQPQNERHSIEISTVGGWNSLPRPVLCYKL